MTDRTWPLALLIAMSACAQQPPMDLSARLHGIEKSKFLSCSGPPQLDYIAAGQERMSMVTNLAHGAQIGIGIASATPLESCSVDAVFEQGRLVAANFGGNPAICDDVFRPCVTK